MGAGASTTSSTIHRLRNMLILSAYKSSGKRETLLRDQFHSRKRVNQTGVAFLTRSDIFEILKLGTSNALSALLARCNLRDEKIGFEPFLSFLENGIWKGNDSNIKSAQCRTKDLCSGRYLGKCMYASVFDHLKFIPAEKSRTLVIKESNPARNNEKGTTPFWKKSETVIEEKIVKYMTLVNIRCSSVCFKVVHSIALL